MPMTMQKSTFCSTSPARPVAGIGDGVGVLSVPLPVADGIMPVPVPVAPIAPTELVLADGKPP